MVKANNGMQRSKYLRQSDLAEMSEAEVAAGGGNTHPADKLNGQLRKQIYYHLSFYYFFFKAKLLYKSPYSLTLLTQRYVQDVTSAGSFT